MTRTHKLHPDQPRSVPILGPDVTEHVRRGDIELILDISRLISRVLHPMPTGVDRVEMAYARTLLELFPDELAFAAVHPSGLYGRIERTEAMAFLEKCSSRWTSSVSSGWFGSRMAAASALMRLRPKRPPRSSARRYYIQASPHHLHREDVVRAKLRRENARFLCLVHDLIPIEFPEYARPDGAELHRRRIVTMIRNADGLIANSQATAHSIGRFMKESDHVPPIRTAHLGTELIGTASVAPLPPMIAPHPPFFVIVSTIEPRKNHILLLNIWRRMVETIGAADTPRLVVVGRRGWENENVVDMLERCETLQQHVVEYSNLPDQALRALMSQAQALLLPSFAEGFGMPVTEALIAGTPVICSDLPALREAGADVPDYIDPLDGPAWIAAVRDYMWDSPRRLSQFDRMRHFRLPGWHDHIATVLDLIGEIDGQQDTRPPMAADLVDA